ncbi:MAG: peptidoglycan binding domain-containing protein [Chloroflexi bacterium]|nr:peptidoglycan binding domain-containing protein [Chloroflexota bacterium]MCL5273341.1 peptidoglycan binding domain-containing protein [Chloroflexota bacterium]
MTSRPTQIQPRFKPWVILAPLLLVAAIAAAVLGAVAWFEQAYAERIYPGITIGPFDVGGMTRTEAEAAVNTQSARMLGMFDFQGARWFAPWPALGIRANAAEAAQQAYQVGRSGSLDQRFADWQARRPAVVTFSYDVALSRQFLESHRADVYIAPRDATVSVADGAATSTNGAAGREIDIDATLQDAFARLLSEQPVEVRTHPIPPAVHDSAAGAAAAQLNIWLQRPFALTMWWDNRMVTRAIAPVERMGWVQHRRMGDGIATALNAEGIRASLAAINAKLGPTAAMRLDEATGMTLSALQRGMAQVWFVVPHGDIPYVIQRGDTFESVGDRYGIPVTRILAANPDIWADGGFVPGQQITIPTQNIMLPAPIGPTNQQRIEVDLTRQRLLAYDSANLVLSASISSGIPKWRTLVGVFQVEEKVDDAYNKLAAIHMPNWLSIYDIGDPGNSLTNGIHALPVLGGGRRLWSGYLGHPVSFGCVVMGIADSDALYKWVQIGTPVLIYGTTPPSPLTYDNLIEAQQKTQ